MILNKLHFDIYFSVACISGYILNADISLSMLNFESIIEIN